MHRFLRPQIALIFTLVALLFLLSGHAIASNIPFSPAVTIAATAVSAQDSFAADLDNDGDQDVLSASATDNEIAWYENTAGDGSAWTTHLISNNAFNAQVVRAADLDNDGDLDVLSASESDDRIAWYENLGGGDFGNPASNQQTISLAAAGAVGLETADFDHDGDLDVVSAGNAPTVGIRWHENLGGSWSDHTIALAPAMSAATWVHAADVDGDGDTDVLAADNVGDQLLWLENNGDGSAWVNHTLAAGANGANSVITADFDRDGDLDALATLETADSLVWYQNDGTPGNGLWATATVINSTLSADHAAYAADMDSDGDLDALSASYAGDTAAWYENTAGDGTTWTERLLSAAVPNATSILAADIDSDGDLDTLTTSETNNSVSWFENNTIHRSAWFPQFSLIATSPTSAIDSADFDGDGDNDLLISISGVIGWRANDGSGAFGATQTVFGEGGHAVYAADVDGDGSQDVIASYLGDISWFPNDGDGGFSLEETIASASFSFQALHTADFDNDGDLDLLSAAPDNDQITWYENDGAPMPGFTAHIVTSDPDGAGGAEGFADAVQWIHAADVDKDGRFDILSASSNDNTIAWYRNLGGGSFSVGSAISTAASGATWVGAGDLDGDGDLDVAAATTIGATWYENTNGTGTFGPQQGLGSGYDCSYAAQLVDLDGDGDLDAITSDACNQLLLGILNDGSGTFTPVLYSDELISHQYLETADFNRDGKVDVVTANEFDGQLGFSANLGGQYALQTTDSAPATLSDGQTDDLLKTRVTNRGRTGDSPLELVTFTVLLEENPGDPLTTTEANNIIENLYIYRDNGSSVFEVGSDFLVSTIGSLSLAGGEQTINFVDGDFQVRVTVTTHQTYFVVVELTADAANQSPDQFRATLLASASTAEDRNSDILLNQEFQPDVASSIVTIPGGGGGTTFTVNTTNDVDDGTCNAIHCSLREALNAANATIGVHELITFDIAGAAPYTIQPTSPLPAITDAVTVDGTTEPDYAGTPVVELDGSLAGVANGLLLTTGENVIRGLAITNFAADGVYSSGSNNSIEANVISNTGGNGITAVGAVNGNILNSNLIFGNGGLGIDLNDDGVTANDIDDGDAGPNNLQNFPVLSRVLPTGLDTLIQGQLNSAANTNYSIDFFVNSSCDESGYGEGEVYVGNTAVSTDLSGYAAISFTLPTSLTPGQFITTITTDAAGNSSEFSRCTPASLGNDSWLTAYELTLSGDPQIPTQVSHFIDSPDQSRWYKFPVGAGSELDITLSQLPANYDVVVYKDINQAFQKEISSTQDLLLLSAEFAPDIFNPDIFNPDIFNPDIFNPDIFNPDIFNPDIFNPDIFNPDIFNPDIFNPDIFNADGFSPDIFNPDIFNPDIFNPDIFNPDIFNEAFSSAQLRSAVGASGLDGLAVESVKVNTWNNDGFYYVRVRGRNGAFDPTTPFQLSVAVDGGVCTGVSDVGLAATSLTAVSADYHTLILVDWAELALTNTPADLDTLQQALTSLTNRPEVAGTVIDVGLDDRVADARQLVNNHLACPNAKNILADAIKAVIDLYWEANPNLEYIVLVGNDAVIPFYRSPDQALLAPESNYVVPVGSTTASYASLAHNYVLSQDAYGARVAVSQKSSELPIAELAVGRLVENASDMTTVINAYLGTSNGVITPTTSLVTGYDFLEDAANVVQEELRLGTNGIPDSLISPQTTAPADSWTADELQTALLENGRHDLIYLAGHFSGGSALAADYTTRLLASQVAASGVDMSNSLVFSAGCHAGYNIVTPDAIPGITAEPDWAQAFASKGATLVAGTGYQYGDSDFLEYGERLYWLFSQQLRTGTNAVSVGQALLAAKQQYLADVGQETSGIYQKQYLIATIYGLPMLRVNMPGERIVVGGGGELLPNTPIVPGTSTYPTPGPGQTLGLEFADVTITPTLTLLTKTLVNVNNISDTITVSYLAGGANQDVVVNPAEPVLPVERYDVTVPGLVLRGVGFRSGVFTGLAGIRPLTGAATYDLSAPRPIFNASYFYPTQLWNTNYYSAIADPVDGQTRLVVTPAQFKSETADSAIGTLRQFDSMAFRLFYSNNTTTYANNNTPYLANPPAISQVLATVNGSQVEFEMRVVGDPAAGVQEVWVTWSDVNAVNGMWQSLDLTQNPDDSSLWQGTLTAVSLNGTAPADVRYMVQAVNGVGLVTLVTNLGNFYQPGVDPGQISGEATELVLENPPTSGMYGTTAQFTAVLSSNGVPLANQLVSFGLGGQKTAVTDANGRATVTLPLSLTPDEYDMQAVFGGTADYQPATAASPFTITKQPTTLAITPDISSVQPGEDSGMVATLRDSLGNALIQQPVFLVVEGANGDYVLSGITNFNGQVLLGVVPLPAGSYEVTAYFGQNFTLPDNTTVDLTDANYEGAIDTAVLNIGVSEQLFISLGKAAIVHGISASDEDILVYDTQADSWALYFDGSDVGLGPRDLDAFTILPDNSILLSLSQPAVVDGVGWVDDSDLLRFVPTSLGDTTAGAFEMYFDGSDVGLTTNDEDIDAMDFDENGRLLISTVGLFSVPDGISGTDADLIALDITSTGQNTAGTWSLHFDGSDVGLLTDKEDIWGVWVDDTTGEIYLTTKSKFDVPGLNGNPSDIFVCTPITLGDTTNCTFELFFNGAAHGLGRMQIDDLAIVR